LAGRGFFIPNNLPVEEHISPLSIAFHGQATFLQSPRFLSL